MRVVQQMFCVEKHIRFISVLHLSGACRLGRGSVINQNGILYLLLQF